MNSFGIISLHQLISLLHGHVLIILLLAVSLQWMQADAFGNETDRIALLKFREGITGDPNGVFSSWNDSTPHCNWFGITCGRRHQRVTKIYFKSQGLVGTISPYIGNLTFLRLIYLRNNSIGGQVPPEVGKLSRLHYLRLSNNTLEGEIPANLSQCLQLKWIELGGNNISGSIPRELGNPLSKIEVIELISNNLVGEIPPSLGNLSFLYFFSTTYNSLTGSIPEELGRLTNLTYFYVGVNRLSGAIPLSLFNMTSIRHFVTVANQIQGHLPDSIGLTLPNLQYFVVGANQLSGKIPSTLSNATQLQVVGLERNRFEGQVPNDIGKLASLQELFLSDNNLESNSTDGLVFLTSLQNCSELYNLDLSSNQFGGVFPNSAGNLSVQLSMFYLGGNFFTGSIPAALANLINLISLRMEQNLFSGVIPPSFGNFPKLQVLSLAANELSGQIPSSIGNSSQLFQLYLQQNSLEGTIPASIGNCRRLFLLSISENNISGAIPREVMSLSSLSQIIFSRNSLTGTLPAEVGKLTSVSTLDISENNISGEIPATIGDYLSLEYLYMQGNSFQGIIPSQLSLLRGLQSLDLSRNNLTGEIPQELQDLPFLQYLNVSFNELQGAVPTGGVFNNSNNISLVGNSELCGGISELHLQKCSTRVAKKRKLPAFKLAIMISCLLLLVALCVAFLAVCWLKKSKKKPTSATEMDMGYHLRVSYRDLYQATNGFSSSNLIGSGSFGSVYKGFLNQIERPVAIKVLQLQQNIAGKSFVAETKALRNIRHRNLVKIITSCSSLDPQGNEFKALVFEFMANFSLEKWLYPDRDDESGSRRLNLLQRLNIAIDVASALLYLHDLSETTIIHRDLKPSNVLLDDDMVAHVGDFGIARLLSTTDEFAQSETSTIGIKGTIGYAAPEYGMGGTASIEGDVYSYGILVLEMFTGKRPTDEIFEQGLSLHEFVKTALQKRVMQIVDSTLLPKAIKETEASGAATIICGNSNEIEAEEGTYTTEDKPSQLKANVRECLLSLLELGVACSAESHKERMKMVDVVAELNRIKSSLVVRSSEARLRGN